MNWAARQQNFISKYFQEKLGKEIEQLKAWLKPDLLFRSLFQISQHTAISPPTTPFSTDSSSQQPPF